jgi:release factor glutamine methyltransferase
MRFKEFVKRRLGHEPLQYILGECEFMSLQFKVNSGVMIPRPETEILVETVLETCRAKFSSNNAIRILEVGTGSGCIAVSLAKHLPTACVTAIDISEVALNTAAENVRLNGVDDRIQLRQLDFMSANFLEQISETFDVLVSNPPYISDEDFPNLPVEIKEYEPRMALKDGSDGLSFYRRIAQLASALLYPKGFVAVEAGLGQAAMVEKIFLEHTFSMVNSFKDLNGIERVVCGEIGNTTN